MELREFVKYLVVDELTHVFDTDVTLANQSFWRHNDLVINDAVFKVTLLLDIEFHVVKVVLNFFYYLLLKLLFLRLLLLPLVEEILLRLVIVDLRVFK